MEKWSWPARLMAGSLPTVLVKVCNSCFLSVAIFDFSACVTGGLPKVVSMGRCMLGSAVVCCSFQPGVELEYCGSNQLLCICCRDGVQFWSTEHLLARIQEDGSAEIGSRNGVGEGRQPSMSMAPIPTLLVNPRHTSERINPDDKAEFENSTGGGNHRLSDSSDQTACTQPIGRFTDVSGDAVHIHASESGATESLRTSQRTTIAGPLNNSVQDEGQHCNSLPETCTPLYGHTIDIRGTSDSTHRHPALAARQKLRGDTVPFNRPADANFGDPLRFAAILSASRSRQPSGTGGRTRASPNSTTRLANRLKALQKERFPANTAAGAVATARVPTLVNFSREDRKYATVPCLKPQSVDVVSCGLKVIPKQVRDCPSFTRGRRNSVPVSLC